MGRLRALNWVCWAIGVASLAALVVMFVMCVWDRSRYGYQTFDMLAKPIATAAILFWAAVATIILNKAIGHFISRTNDEARGDQGTQPLPGSE